LPTTRKRQTHSLHLTRQVPNWHMSTKSFQTNGRAKIRIKFFKYSASREYMLQPDAVEYDENTMTKPGFDLILSADTVRE